MTKVAAIETANHGITVNAIWPGWVLTPLVQRQLEDQAKQECTDVETQKHRFLTEKQAMAEFSTPEQIGALSVFLCSEDAKTIIGAPLRSTAAGLRSSPRSRRQTSSVCKNTGQPGSIGDYG